MIRPATAIIDRARAKARDGWPEVDIPHDVVGRSRPRQALLVLLLFAGLSALHTWPLAASIGSLSRHDNADAILNEWAVAWIAHQLPRDPLHLFDANIFYPESNTLAFSEHMFVQGLMGAPLLWAGLPTLFVHNLLILAGFTLTGWTMALVMRRRTGSWACGILGGMLLAFNAHSLSRIAHLQAVHVEFLPLALYALDRLLTRPNVANALRLSLTYVLQGLTSNYLLVFMTFGLAGAGLARASEWLGRGRLRVLGLVVLAGGIATVLMAPFLVHYLEAQREQGLTRSLEEVARYGASWRDYLSATGNIHYRTWSAEFWRREGAALFPGITALVLAGVAIASGLAWRHRPARMWLSLAIVGFVLSFGTALPGYEYLYRGMPMLQGIRASVRFGYLVLVGVAALAPFGLMVLRSKYAHQPRVSTAVTAAALLLVSVEALRIPVGYSAPYSVPSVYGLLRDEPAAVLIELPMAERGVFHLNAPYMLNSTLHWRPLVNGYSGFLPRSYDAHYEAMRTFPDERSLAYLRQLGVTHVAVHSGGYRHPAGQEMLKTLPAVPGLRAAIKTPGLTIYKVRSVTP